VADICHGLGARENVWKNAFGYTSTFVCCDEKPFICIFATYELIVLEGFAHCCIDEGVGRVECSGNVCDLCGKNIHVMLDYDVGMKLLTAGMNGMMGWEALSTFSAVGASCAGSTFGSRGAGKAWMNGDAGPQESGSVSGIILGFCCTASILAWVFGGGDVCGNGNDAAGDCCGPCEALRRWCAQWCDS
jgi:hypothetical protein